MYFFDFFHQEDVFLLFDHPHSSKTYGEPLIRNVGKIIDFGQKMRFFSIEYSDTSEYSEYREFSL